MEEDEEFLVEEMILTLESYSGELVPARDAVLRRLREGEYLYFADDEIRERTRGRLEMMGVGCYVFYSFNHFGPDLGTFIKVGSTVHDPEGRAYAHLISSSSTSDIIGCFGADYVARARLGLGRVW